LIVEHIGRKWLLWLESIFEGHLLIFSFLKILTVLTFLVDEVSFGVKVLQLLVVSGNIILDHFEVWLFLILSQSCPNLSKTFGDFSDRKSWVVRFEVFSSGCEESKIRGQWFLWHHSFFDIIFLFIFLLSRGFFDL
jgi:hypothetical protein